MPNSPVHARILAPLVLLAAMCATTQPAAAQNPFPGQPGLRTNEADEKIITDVNFQGGTVHSYLEYLRGVSPDNAVNTVVTDDLGKATLPAIRLRLVTALQATGVIDDLISEKREVDREYIQSGSSGTVVSLRFQRTGNPFNDNPFPIAIFQVNDIVAAEKGAGPLTSGSLPMDTVLTAIESAIKLIGGTPPEIKYHADSGLLLVKGNESQTSAASQVLNALRESAGRVDGMGGGKWTRSWTLVNRDAHEIVSAFREVFPPGSEQAEAVKVEGNPQTNSVIVTAPRNMAVAADVLVRYVDRAEPVNQDIIRLEAMLQSARQQQVNTESHTADAVQRLEAQRDAMAAEMAQLRVQLDQTRRQLETLQAAPKK